MKAIPTWKQRKLRELSDIVGGGTPSTNIKEYWDGDINWYSPVEIGNDVYTYQSRKKITQLGLQKSSAKILPAGRTILFTSRAGIGDMAILENTGTTNQGFQSIIVKEDNDVYFIYSYGAKIKKKAIKFASGSTFLEISGKELGKLQLKVPSLIEQQKIGVLLKKIDNTIALHQEKLSKLQSLKEAALQSLFPQKNEKEPKVRFANFKEIWKQYKLKDVIESELKGKAKAKDKTNDCKNVYLETNYLNGGEVSYVDVPNDVDEDDVLILWDGSQAGTVYHGYKGALGSTLKAYKPKESGEFMFQYLKKNQQKIYDNYRTPNIPHVVKTFTEDFRIKSTSIIEQRKISSFFKQLDSTINFYQDKLEKLQLLKKAFLQKMFI